jgi:hypothetical protein
MGVFRNGVIFIQSFAQIGQLIHKFKWATHEHTHIHTHTEHGDVFNSLKEKEGRLKIQKLEWTVMRPVIWTEISLDFTQFLKANYGISPRLSHKCPFSFSLPLIDVT